VASAAGVSIATVSRVLSGRGPVADATRAAVLDAVASLGRGAPLVRSRAAAPARVYVRCPYVLTDYFGLVVSSVAETLALHGREVVLDAGESAQGVDPLAKLSARDDLAGAVLVLPPEPGEELVALRQQGFPFVVIDPRTPAPPDIASVAAAHFGGARRLTAHLLGRGHRRIGVVGGPREWSAAADRAAGHASAMVEAGIMPSAELAHAVEPTVEEGYRAGGLLLDLPDRPTAVVGFNDKAALGILRAAEERGLRVPEDLSVAGFDDSDVARATRPQLTTVRQPLEEMGRMAVGLLVRLMDQHKVEALHIELATELVVRGSTGPVQA
jgi:LacI family transcriptional regulator